MKQWNVVTKRNGIESAEIVRAENEDVVLTLCDLQSEDKVRMRPFPAPSLTGQKE